MSLLRMIIDSSTHAICYAKRRRRIRPSCEAKQVKLNLGCGLAVTKDWINVDGSLNALIASWPRVFHRGLHRLTGSNRYYSCAEYCTLLEDHTFVHHDLSYGIPFEDESVDFIYSSHFLEHLHKQDAHKLLVDCYRVLKPGGVIRICVPDLAYAISLYQAGDKEIMLKDYFFVEDKESYFARHKYMYDLELLSSILQKALFSKVRQWPCQQGMTPDLNLLDNRSKETLYVEAVKS